MKATVKLVMLSLICILMVAACAKPQAAPQTTSANRIPVIESLQPASNQTYPGGMVEIRSKVNYTGENTVNYRWSCSGGHFRDTGATAVWVAPQQYASYDITLAVDDGKGGSSQASVSITVGANQPPQIIDIKAEPTNVQLEGTSTLTCTATDPDGDTITYGWSAKEGALSGQGNKVSWTAPRKPGNFSIAIVARDNKGGESRQEVVVGVSASSSVVIVNLTKPESGTVTSDGDKDTSYYRTGDDEKNIGYRAFFSFNIYQFRGMEIRQARLKFSGTRVAGDPFDPVSGLGVFKLDHLSYGSALPKFDIEGGPLQRAESQYNKPLTDVDVTPEMVNDIGNRLERFQVEARFQKGWNGNNVADFVQWSDVTLEVTVAPK